MTSVKRPGYAVSIQIAAIIALAFGLVALKFIGETHRMPSGLGEILHWATDRTAPTSR